MAETLSTVVVAALTSGTVTLGIEWVFKPRLEARKERLLEIHRKRRKFESQMVTVMINIAKWTDVDLSDERRDTVTMLLAQDKEAAERQIDAAVVAMNDEAYDIAAPYVRPIRDLVLRYIFNARMIQISDRPQAVKWTLLRRRTESAHAWLFCGTWRFWTRANAMSSLRTVLDNLEAKEPAEPDSR